MSESTGAGAPEFPRLKDGGPAFPYAGAGYGGMTLRDYFAAKVLPFAAQNVASQFPLGEKLPDTALKYAATVAYKAADAMLAARAKP